MKEHKFVRFYAVGEEGLNEFYEECELAYISYVTDEEISSFIKRYNNYYDIICVFCSDSEKISGMYQNGEIFHNKEADEFYKEIKAYIESE